MKTSPVSFGSLMCFTINNGQPKLAIPRMLQTAFAHNDKLSGYTLEEDIFEFKEDVDGTVHNAAADFCDKLDVLHKNDLKGTKNVKITRAEFYTSPLCKEPRYFITAPTAEDENKILRALGVSKDFYTVRFREKKC